jgi:hypothetical protein
MKEIHRLVSSMLSGFSPIQYMRESPVRRPRAGVFLLCAGMPWLLSLAVLQGQSQRNKDVLTDQQTEALREAADDPSEKAKLFLGYIEDRVTEIHRLATDPSERNREPKIHNRLDEFTSLSDELEDNLDSYDQQHADMRKALKLIVEKSEKWPAALNEPKPDSAYDFARKAALEAAQSVQNDTKKMLEDETKYFEEQKEAQKKENKKNGS